MRLAGRRGHALLKNGLNTSAKSILNEYQEAQKVLDALKTYMDFLDVSTPEKVASDQNSDLDYGINKINTYKPELSFSLHLNAGGGTGCEVFYYTGSTKGKRAAEKVAAALAELGFKNRGAKPSTVYKELRKTTAPHIIIEICFTDTQADADLLHKLGPDAVARKIVKGLTGAEPAAPVLEKTEAAQDVETEEPAVMKYQVVSGTYATMDEAEARAAKLQKAGFSTKIMSI